MSQMGGNTAVKIINNKNIRLSFSICISDDKLHDIAERITNKQKQEEKEKIKIPEKVI